MQLPGEVTPSWTFNAFSARSPTLLPHRATHDPAIVYTAGMRAGSRASYSVLLPPVCVLCEAKATTTLVPTTSSLLNRETGKTVHVTTMRLCESCRSEVVSKRVALGWSWRAEGWGRAGTESPAGDKYQQHDA
jgi:hypothetical protein